MQGALLSLPQWDMDTQVGTVPSPINSTVPSTVPYHASTVPTPTKSSPAQSLPSPLLNWRPNVNVPPPVFPPPPATPTHHSNGGSPCNPSAISPCMMGSPVPNPSPASNGMCGMQMQQMQQKQMLVQQHMMQRQGGVTPPAFGAAVRPSELQDFNSVEDYMQYLEREVGRVEQISFRVRLPDGRLTLFESEMPLRRRSFGQPESGLKVDVDCQDDAEDNALRNLSEWEEPDACLARQAMSMPDMRHYRHEPRAVTEPGLNMMTDASFRSAATSFPSVVYNAQCMPHTVAGVPLLSPGNNLQTLVQAAASVPQQPLLNMRAPFAPPLSPGNVLLPPTPTGPFVRGPAHTNANGSSVTPVAGTSSASTPLAPESPEYGEGSESPNSGCSTENDNDDESANGQRMSLKPSLPGCQHSAYWKRLRHKKGTTHFLCVYCGCKWRRVSQDEE